MHTKRILVTGGTGFLGRHLVRRLLGMGSTVRVVGRNPTACDALAACGVQIVRADLSDASMIARACGGVDAVVHAAALSAPWGRREDFVRSNVDGTANVLAGCRAHGVKQLVHISSPSVIFDGTDHLNADETAPYSTRWLCHYSHTKKIAEERVKGAASPDLAVTMLRPKAIFGPGDTALLPRLVSAAAAGRLPQVGAGDNLVDITYVENVVQAIVLSLESSFAAGKNFRLYHITNDEHVRLWDLLRDVLTRLGYPRKLRRVPYALAYGLAAAMEMRARTTGREPLLTRYTVGVLGRTQTYDIAAARQDLGYRPRVSVAEGIERTVADLMAAKNTHGI